MNESTFIDGERSESIFFNDVLVSIQWSWRSRSWCSRARGYATKVADLPLLVTTLVIFATNEGLSETIPDTTLSVHCEYIHSVPTNIKNIS